MSQPVFPNLPIPIIRERLTNKAKPKRKKKARQFVVIVPKPVFVRYNETDFTRRFLALAAIILVIMCSLSTWSHYIHYYALREEVTRLAKLDAIHTQQLKKLTGQQEETTRYVGGALRKAGDMENLKQDMAELVAELAHYLAELRKRR